MAFPVSPGFSENPSAAQAIFAVFHHRVLLGSLIKNFSRAIEINMKFIFAAEFPWHAACRGGAQRAQLLQNHPTCSPLGGNGNLPLETASPGTVLHHSAAALLKIILSETTWHWGQRGTTPGRWTGGNPGREAEHPSRDCSDAVPSNTPAGEVLCFFPFLMDRWVIFLCSGMRCRKLDKWEEENFSRQNNSILLYSSLHTTLPRACWG